MILRARIHSKVGPIGRSRRPATANPAFHPGALTRPSGLMASIRWPLKARSQAVSEFEFHISPVAKSSRPHVAFGKTGTSLSTRPAIAWSSFTLFGPPIVCEATEWCRRRDSEPRSETTATGQGQRFTPGPRIRPRVPPRRRSRPTPFRSRMVHPPGTPQGPNGTAGAAFGASTRPPSVRTPCRSTARIDHLHLAAANRGQQHHGSIRWTRIASRPHPTRCSSHAPIAELREF